VMTSDDLWEGNFCGEGIYPRWVAKRPPADIGYCLGLLRSPTGINPLATGLL